MKPWVLICIGLVWLGAIIGFLGYVKLGILYFIVTPHTLKLEVALLVYFFFLLGWLIPLSIGVLRLLRKTH
jgi:hypothetical protein